MNSKKTKAIRRIARLAFKTEMGRNAAIKKWKSQYKLGIIEVPNHKTTIRQGKRPEIAAMGQGHDSSVQPGTPD